MRKYVVRSLLLLAFLGAPLAGGLSVVGKAHADTITEANEAWLESTGGREICAEFDRLGMTSDTVVAVFDGITKLRSTDTTETAALEVKAVRLYCSQYWSQLGSIVNKEPLKQAV